MRRFVFSILVLSLFVSIAPAESLAPGKTVSASPAGPADPVAPSFSKQIFPILKTKCNADECHGVKGAAQFLSYAAIRLNAKKIAKRIVDYNGPMPPLQSGIRLTVEEKLAIKQWVEAGAPKN